MRVVGRQNEWIGLHTRRDGCCVLRHHLPTPSSQRPHLRHFPGCVCAVRVAPCLLGPHEHRSLGAYNTWHPSLGLLTHFTHSLSHSVTQPSTHSSLQRFYWFKPLSFYLHWLAGCLLACCCLTLIHSFTHSLTHSPRLVDCCCSDTVCLDCMNG